MPKSADPAPLEPHQRQYLKGLAHLLDPVVLVGEEGVSDGVIGAIDAALTTHELIKVRMRRPPDKKAAAAAMAERTGATLCGLIGHTVVLYRRHPKKPKIHVPARK